MENPKIRPIAMYLPQYHPIPENDAWWGKGFTEWRNVVKAKPRFKGHYQPHLPADLGFYDLRLEEARLAQEELAKQYGIYGFCYYHYWFNGKRLLNEPIDRKIKNPKEDLPFMFCWANENWTRAWDGGENEILIEQKYSHDDDENHIRALIPYFKDERYIKVDGNPVFIIYRPHLFPDIKKTIETFKNEAIIAGLRGLHFGYMQTWGKFDPPQSIGFDFAVEFHPFAKTNSYVSKKYSLHWLVTKVRQKSLFYFNQFSKRKPDTIRDYQNYVAKQMSKQYFEDICPGITPGWDNSARRKNGALILKNANPESYAKWLNHILNNYPWDKSKEKFLFINAWNEWAEGNHIEPCLHWGRSFLEATRDSLANTQTE